MKEPRCVLAQRVSFRFTNDNHVGVWKTLALMASHKALISLFLHMPKLRRLPIDTSTPGRT